MDKLTVIYTVYCQFYEDIEKTMLDSTDRYKINIFHIFQCLVNILLSEVNKAIILAW